MNRIFFEIIVIFLLIFLNSLFSMAEMALVSARKSRLEKNVETGRRGAARALDLSKNPTRFLSTVQIGITLIGILNGAFGGATLSEEIAARIGSIPFLNPISEELGVALVVLVITYFSLVLGELVPKRIALNNAENIAISLSPFMHLLSVIVRPIVNLLSISTDIILRFIGIRPSRNLDITEDDFKSILLQGTQNGIFNKAEQDMVERVLRLGDRKVSALMTPRTDIVAIDLSASTSEILQTITNSRFSRYPVIQDELDNIVGIVHIKDLFAKQAGCSPIEIRSLIRPVLFVPESVSTLHLLEMLKREKSEIAFVIDEYGGLMGLVSLQDILEAITSDASEPIQDKEAEAFKREDGSWLFDGLIPVDEIKILLNIKDLPDEAESRYDTLSGLMMSALGRIPTSGDHFEWDSHRFEVVDMDGHRVDKVLVIPKSLKNS